MFRPQSTIDILSERTKLVEEQLKKEIEILAKEPGESLQTLTNDDMGINTPQTQQKKLMVKSPDF